MKYISHSGRLRSSGVLAILPMASSSSRRPPGRRHPPGPDVVVEVDLAVLPPHRVVELERDVDEFVAERVELVEPAVDDLAELVDAELSGPSASSSSITAILRVCMCTFGVSLYSSTASQPAEPLHAAPLHLPRQGPYKRCGYMTSLASIAAWFR